MSNDDPTREYVVSWKIDILATSPEVAADLAREIQLDPDNIADLFEVTDADTGKCTIQHANAP